MKDPGEPFPVLAELARRFGVEQYRLAMVIALFALPLLSMLIAGAIGPLV